MYAELACAGKPAVATFFFAMRAKLRAPYANGAVVRMRGLYKTSVLSERTPARCARDRR
jgi:hypothetical protein